MKPIRPLFAALILGFAATASAQHAHEHGVADFRVAVDGSTVLVEFDSPLANLVGFEHTARSDAERKAMADLKARLEAPDGLLTLPSGAQCVLQDVELELPDAEGHAHDHDDHKHDHAEEKGHGHSHRHAHEEHAHSHGHGESHDHDHEHGDEHDHEHADAYAAWAFECSNAAAMDAVQVSVIEAFPGVRVLRAETAGPSGQKALRIETPKARLAL